MVKIVRPTVTGDAAPTAAPVKPSTLKNLPARRENAKAKARYDSLKKKG